MSHPLNDLAERILYQQADLLVVNKPPDMPSTGRNLDDEDCLQWHLMRHLNTMVWAIHQLDADTSGLNLFCTNKKLIPVYKAALGNEGSSKEYLAIIDGSPSWDHYTIEASIGKIDQNNMGICGTGKYAKTSFTVIDRGIDATATHVRIWTGRTHQIRIHAAHLGYPLIGEEWYRQPPCTKHPRQALHAWHLHLHGLPDKQTYSWHAPLSEDLQQLCHQLSLYKLSN